MQSVKPSLKVPRSIGRVLDLLEIVLSEGECTLTIAASLSNLTPTTALRHLRALESRGYIRRDTAGLFSAGSTLFRFAEHLHSTGPVDRLIARVQPHLDKVATATGESTYLALSDGSAASYIAVAEGTYAIRHVGWVGQRVSLKGTAVGAALRKPSVLHCRTGAVEADITALSIAVPTTDSLNSVISVLGPTQRMSEEMETVSNTIQQAVDAMTAELETVQRW